METRLYEGDIKIADELMSILIEDAIIEKYFDYETIQYKRIIAVLTENEYIYDATTHLQQTERTDLYFNDGGAKAIYDRQERARKKEELEYTNLKGTNIRSWIAIGISVSVLIWEIISSLF